MDVRGLSSEGIVGSALVLQERCSAGGLGAPITSVSARLARALPGLVELLRHSNDA